MKNLLLFAFLFLGLNCYCQNDYDSGFRAGYENGYCYGENGCVPPVPPPAPVSLPGESGTYQEGYNRGVLMGSQERQREQLNNSRFNAPNSAVAPNVMNTVKYIPDNEYSNGKKNKAVTIIGVSFLIAGIIVLIAIISSGSN